MLEIIALVLLTRRIGTIVEQKGHSSGGYKLLTVVLWIGGELAGAMLGAASMQGYYGESQITVYVTALLGAAAGAAVAYLIAVNLPQVGAQSARWVTELVALYCSSYRGAGFVTDSAAAEPVRVIGEQIYKSGGKPLMLRVHAAFANQYPLGARNLEMVWDGIGEWRG